jgi:hypothetical protein
LKKKYVIFKDDDVGKDFQGLKKWINIVLKNDAKGAIGLIGKCIKNTEIHDFINSLDQSKIEVFCHGYFHSYLPFFINNKLFNKKRVLRVEFDKDEKNHNRSLAKYRVMENKYLNTKSVTFGPPGNIWNNTVIEPLIKHDFKMMFSWRKVKGNLFTIPLSDNLKQNSLDEFIKRYEKNKDDSIYTLQFHHAELTEQQFDLMVKVIHFLKKDGRIFVTPSNLLKIFNE